MAAHKPRQFFIFHFAADDGKHTVSVGAPDREGAIALITDMYSNVLILREIPRVGKYFGRGTMQGWVYRRAIGLKDFGERLSRVKIFGVRVFWRPAGWIIMLGLALRDRVLKHPVR
jgi:hypothetical protein